MYIKLKIDFFHLNYSLYNNILIILTPIIMTYLSKQIETFYKFIGDITRIHFDNLPDGETFEDKFLDVLMLRFLKDKGIKRKMNKKTIQLFYDKNEKGYNKDDMVTQLCRSIILDASNLKILSLGVTKSVDYETFKTEHPDMSPENSYLFQEYPDGTMIMVNPELESYQSVLVEVPTEKDDDSENPIPDGTLPKKKDIQFSTRRVLGTGYFDNSSKTFAEMMKDNFTNTGVDFDKMMEMYKENHCLVFNVQHKDHRMITPDVSRNTLVKVYQTKSTEEATSQYNAMMSSLGTEDFDTHQKAFYTNMVTEIPLEDVNKKVDMENLNILQKCTLPQYDWDSIEKYVSDMDEFQQGICLVSPSGQRIKIRNPKYTELRALKGNLPIYLEQKNHLNVFKLFWNLRQEKYNLSKFCKYFDKEDKYRDIFKAFSDTVHNLTLSLFTIYQDLNVRRTLTRDDVPWHMWPLCCDLHKIYREKRTKIYKPVVYTYVNTMPVMRIYERMFDPHGMKIRCLNTLLQSKMKELNFSFNETHTCHLCNKKGNEVVLNHIGVTVVPKVEDNDDTYIIDDVSKFDINKLVCSECSSSNTD